METITPTEYDCYGKVRPLTISWSRINDWAKCRHRVKLMFEGKRSKLTNARNFLAGNLTDHSMRHALENASKDPDGRLLSLSVEELLAPLPGVWEKAIQSPEKNTVFKWDPKDPVADQKKILLKATESLEKLHPILERNLLGRRYIPEFRPKEMPIIGIPGPYGETAYIRLFLAVDCAVQVEEGSSGDSSTLGKWGLYDLKTTSSVEYINKTLPQLVFYDIAFQALTRARPVEHGLWAPLLDNPEIKAEVTDAHRDMVLNWIISYCHSVWAGEADFTKDETNCYTCPTRSACPKVLTPLTKDEQGISRVYFGHPEGMMQNDGN